MVLLLTGSSPELHAWLHHHPPSEAGVQPTIDRGATPTLSEVTAPDGWRHGLCALCLKGFGGLAAVERSDDVDGAASAEACPQPTSSPPSTVPGRSGPSRAPPADTSSSAFA